MMSMGLMMSWGVSRFCQSILNERYSLGSTPFGRHNPIRQVSLDFFRLGSGDIINSFSKGCRNYNWWSRWPKNRDNLINNCKLQIIFLKLYIWIWILFASFVVTFKIALLYFYYRKLPLDSVLWKIWAKIPKLQIE